MKKITHTRKIPDQNKSQMEKKKLNIKTGKGEQWGQTEWPQQQKRNARKKVNNFQE